MTLFLIIPGSCTTASLLNRLALAGSTTNQFGPLQRNHPGER